jgi:hypothetical protein
MPNAPGDSGDSGKGIILGAILVGRTRELPVNYFPEVGVVKAGIRTLGNATDLRKALAIARAKKKFKMAEKFRFKVVSRTG